MGIICFRLESAIHVIGDSHSSEFSGIKDCFIHHIGPRTMYRVGRNGLKILNFKDYNVSENDLVILTFGEIDVRCHIGKQVDFHGRELDEVLSTLVSNYLNTVLENMAIIKKFK